METIVARRDGIEYDSIAQIDTVYADGCGYDEPYDGCTNVIID